MGHRGCGGHQKVSFQRAKGATAEAKERVEFPVVKLGSGNYAKLLERSGRVPRVVMMVHFDSCADGEAKAAAVVEGARGARADREAGASGLGAQHPRSMPSRGRAVLL